jgi:hypothetical protein
LTHNGVSVTPRPKQEWSFQMRTITVFLAIWFGAVLAAGSTGTIAT